MVRGGGVRFNAQTVFALLVVMFALGALFVPSFQFHPVKIMRGYAEWQRQELRFNAGETEPTYTGSVEDINFIVSGTLFTTVSKTQVKFVDGKVLLFYGANHDFEVGRTYSMWYKESSGGLELRHLREVNHR